MKPKAPSFPFAPFNPVFPLLPKRPSEPRIPLSPFSAGLSPGAGNPCGPRSPESPFKPLIPYKSKYRIHVIVFHVNRVCNYTTFSTKDKRQRGDAMYDLGDKKSFFWKRIHNS